MTDLLKPKLSDTQLRAKLDLKPVRFPPEFAEAE